MIENVKVPIALVEGANYISHRWRINLFKIPLVSLSGTILYSEFTLLSGFKTMVILSISKHYVNGCYKFHKCSVRTQHDSPKWKYTRKPLKIHWNYLLNSYFHCRLKWRISPITWTVTILQKLNGISATTEYRGR